MNIGIDIDNVISDYDNCFIKECLLHDKTLRNNGVINIHSSNIFWMFDWTPEEADFFYKNNAERMGANLTPIYHSKEYIDKLKADGHKIIIITVRDDGTWCNPHTLTRTWLSNNHIYYDKLIFTRGASFKLEKCFENNINLMIDDSKTVYQDCIENNIPALLMDTTSNRDISAIRVHSWKEIYHFVSLGGWQW